MPKIYDNIENKLAEGLREMLDGARGADFCIGYFNLRGWRTIIDKIETIDGECRLLIGMTEMEPDAVWEAYASHKTVEITQKVAYEQKVRAVAKFAEQLTWGCPSAADERNLKRLAKQLRDGKVRVKFHARHRLHAKLYLIHRQDQTVAIAGVVGSSNLTFSGLQKNGELNIDVLDQDAAQKLAKWFNDRWDDDWSPDVSMELAEIIENSWAGREIPPYHVYLKTAYKLSQNAISGVNEYPVPVEFRDKILDFQAKAVSIAAKILSRQNGVIIGDVVGLGKTIIASAVAKTFQEDSGDNVLIICPPHLEEMWGDYKNNYLIAGDILSSGKIEQLEKMRRYRLIIVDESHRFRNRDTARYGHLHDYIEDNNPRVILLTATPYNKAFSDISSQLRLFVKPDVDLGIYPEHYIRAKGGVAKFQREHANTLISSLGAFEKSDFVDDWRELMSRYMVRRTRSHIKANYAERDEKTGRQYLTFVNGDRFYFPERQPERLNFGFDKSGFNKNDDYAKLYSKEVVNAIGELQLPRYGLQQYIAQKYAADINAIPEDDRKIITNLTRAGARLRGFARSGLFKRLESGGDTFLKSIRRHIIRNAVYIAALEEGGKIPIGQIHAAETDESLDEADEALFLNDSPLAEEEELEEWRSAGKRVYQNLKKDKRIGRELKWISASYFKAQLSKDLEEDVRLLQRIFSLVPRWLPENDRKLEALAKLVQITHASDKILIFTQYKDTADYLHKELWAKGVENLGIAHGEEKDIINIVRRFSPKSNGQVAGQLNELRVLVSTDVLSEGQNLQDAHIIVNYDLPWAIIRLVQRAGRVDRIGQTAPVIFCYSALPENGIDKIIDLRERLRKRMNDNNELIGSDERFFDSDERNGERTLRDLYSGHAMLGETDEETDLLSRAYEIWRKATDNDKELRKKIKNLPDVIYSAKSSDARGVIAYVRIGGNDVLAHVDNNGKIVSHSQSGILDLLECTPDTQRARAMESHHECVRKVTEQAAMTPRHLGGQLGSMRSVRHKLYDRLLRLANSNHQTSLWDKPKISEAAQAVYDNPLKDTACDKINRMLKTATEDQLLPVVLEMMSQKTLCAVPDDKDDKAEIICSMGLVE